MITLRIVTIGALVCMACSYDPSVPGGALPTLDDGNGPGSFVAVSAGAEHSCALTVSGTPYCWGNNEFGQLGVASDATCHRNTQLVPCALTPVAVSGGVLFQKISAGGRVTCGLSAAAFIYCWGDNVRGGLGEPTVSQTTTPVAIASTATFMDVAVGDQHACGIRSDGVTFCWGYNDMGQLGNNASGSGSAVPVQVAGTLRFVSIAAGAHRTCARQFDGATYCWGATFVNNLGGLEVTRPQTTPARVQTTATPTFTSVAVGGATTCGITPSLGAFCWEANPAGGIGDGTAAGSTTPRAVVGTTRWVAISSGAMHSCGIDDTGLAHCWGAGDNGQLGISPVFLATRCAQGSVACSTVPVRVSGWRQFVSISAGQGNHSCGLTLGGNVYCWGAGGLGQLGNGNRFTGDWAPSRIVAPL